ncbi:MAG TPA: hypothetical protein VMF55_12890 [Solirubrobacterales bacterium]|nr:hypothetical protein [Solirubrobacterales bacterium]
MLALVALLLAGASLASAEVLQRGDVRITLRGSITPTKLPRSGSAPVRVAVGTKITAMKQADPRRLTRISIAINRYGRLDPTGLPVCTEEDIQPATTQKALEACRGSLVGEGSFAAVVDLDRQASFPSAGKLLAFAGTYEGTPAILAHIYGTEPVPTSLTLPFRITRSKGTFATVLTARLPASEAGYVTALSLDLHRDFSFRGARRSYASASCPAPKGFPGAVFPFAKVSYRFAGGRAVTADLAGHCQVR